MTQLKIGELIAKPNTLSSDGDNINIYVLSETLDINTYADITSNVSWNYIGINLTNFKICRDQISEYTSLIGFNNLSLEDKKIASKYFVVSKDLRDIVHSDYEQKENAMWLITTTDSFNLYNNYIFNSDNLYSADTISNSYIKEKKVYPQKFKLTENSNDPKNIDYDVYGLHKKRTIAKGELILVEYFKTFNPTANTFSNLILTENRSYTRDVLGLIQNRAQTTSWLFEDETTGETKTTYKFYSATESIDEGITRRKNIIAEAKVYALSSIGQMTGFDLMTSVKTQIELYIDGYKTPLIDGINMSTKPYMGAKQVNGVTATTIVNTNASQIDSITVNGVEIVYTSSTLPTKLEVVSGLVSAITASTNSAVNKYVTALVSAGNESLNIVSKIPGISFTVSVSSNLSTTLITANNRTIKDSMINILTF